MMRGGRNKLAFASNGEIENEGISISAHFSTDLLTRESTY